MVRYEIVNMFADRPFAGSALTVVPDAERLSSEAMQAIAREINTTETAFVLPASSVRATYQVRVFTPEHESPFGGHSSVGTAGTLLRLGRISEGPVLQECGSRLLELIAHDDEVTLSVSGPLQGGLLDPRPLLAACGLTDDDLAAPPRTAGFGPLFHFLPVREDALARAEPDPRAVPEDVFVFSWDPSRQAAHARLFAPGYGMPEDAACAPAAAAFGVWLAEMGRLSGRDGVHTYRIEQGQEMARPASLDCTVTLRDGRPTAGSVSGRVVALASGEIAVLSSASPAPR